MLIKLLFRPSSLILRNENQITALWVKLPGQHDNTICSDVCEVQSSMKSASAKDSDFCVDVVAQVHAHRTCNVMGRFTVVVQQNVNWVDRTRTAGQLF
jgi:hypothetical protein